MKPTVKNRDRAGKNTKSVTVTLRIPLPVLDLAEKQAKVLGVTTNMLLVNVITCGLGCELIETGILSRIMHECVRWMRDHGAKDAPVPPPVPSAKKVK
jgi:hypothetical protein